VNTIREIINHIESIAPLSLQESYDNAGLIIGDGTQELTGILICLDSTEEVVDEAISLGYNLIIAHHPIIFSGLKKFTGNTYVEKTIVKAIKNNIAIYAAHTNLDNIPNGVNAKIAEKLGLKETRILQPMMNQLQKLTTFCPLKDAEKVRSALFNAGAGQIGKYDECSFNIEGEGTFRAGNDANPYVGEKEERHIEREVRIELIFPSYLQSNVLKELLKAHPYEEVAYDILPLLNKNKYLGAGMIGELEEEMNVVSFLKEIKLKMNCEMLKYTKPHLGTVKRVALCGGSGSFLLKEAIKQKADIFITADFKYHQFFDAENKIIIADIGHYESEQYTKELFYDLIMKKFPKFAVRLSKINTNPVNYL
jgi:dinuclear metal center YbgI/SA1388 family protein